MYRHVPMRELLFILILVFAAAYWILNPGQIDSARIGLLAFSIDKGSVLI